MIEERVPDDGKFSSISKITKSLSSHAKWTVRGMGL
jgi:hypothetical protein